MSLYEYHCDDCGTVQVRFPMSTGPTAPDCLHGPMQRVYGSGQRAIVQLGAPEYIEKAYRGEELPPGMTQRQVRAIVDSRPRGQHANGHQYKTLR